MEGSLSTFGGPSWGADSTSPQPPETTRTRVSVQTPSPENNLLDDPVRLQVNSIRGTLNYGKFEYFELCPIFTYRCILIQFN